MFRKYLQILQAITDADKVKRHTFCVETSHWVENDYGFLECIIFCDEGTFQLSVKVNKHTARILGSQNPHTHVEHIRDSPKGNVS